MIIPIQIRFADCDLAGHVHNAAYLHYFESARLVFFKEKLGENWDWKKTGVILKKNTITYNQPSYLEETLYVKIWCSHIGDKSFTLNYLVFDENKTEKTHGESVLVCFDYTQQKTISIPSNFKQALLEISKE